MPDDLAAAVTRCLRRDPEARWPDARALREAVSPSALEADQLPEPLDTLDGLVPFLLPFALAWLGSLLALLMADFQDPHDPMGPRPFDGRALLFVLLSGFLLGRLPIAWSAVRVARARGFAWRAIDGALLRQPEWWLCLWYPSRFRRAGDVWDGLPRPFRAWRIIVTAALVDLVVLAKVALVTGPLFLPGRDLVAVRLFGSSALDALNAIEGIAETTPLPLVLVLLFVGLGVALAVTSFFCARFMHRQGLDTYTLRRVSHTMIVASTARRGPWRNPAVAKLLLPARVARRRREPRTAPEFVAALAQAAKGAADAARPAVQHAADAARGLADAIEAQDAAIARLARHADPAEAARLRERLAALRDSGDPESGALGELLVRQLSLLDDMTARLAAARSSRDGSWAALQGLWRAVDDYLRGPTDAEAARGLAAAVAGAAASSARPLDSAAGEATSTKA